MKLFPSSIAFASPLRAAQINCTIPKKNTTVAEASAKYPRDATIFVVILSINPLSPVNDV
jgi:hypothetical protein